MQQTLATVAYIVRDYDEAIQFFVETLGFNLVEDTCLEPDQPGKRWVVVRPGGSVGCSLLLAKAEGDSQLSAVGNQTGGRVFLFLNSDDFWRDYNEMVSRGINFVREPKVESYGTVAVFEDLYGNLWDFIEPTTSNKIDF